MTSLDPPKTLLAVHDGKVADSEKQEHDQAVLHTAQKPIYKKLSLLDRLLALWILLAIMIGILLGNFVNGVEEALQKGKFVNVSVPIGRVLPEPRTRRLVFTEPPW